jgi:hypothetical protein
MAFKGCVLIVALLLTRSVLAAESYREQRAKLETMSAEEKEQLQRKKERFEALSQSEQQRLRELHSAVAATAESDQLLAVMSRYNDWLKTLTSAVRAELLSLPPEERIKRIKELKQDQERQRFREFANNLPEQDMNIIYSWIEDFVGRNESEFIKRIPPEFRRRLEQQRDGAERRKALVTSLMWRRGDDDSPKPSEADVAELLPKLSEETRKQIDRTTSAEEKLSAVRTLAGAAVLSKVFPPISDEQRQQVFAKLNPVERDRLEQMAPDMMRRELTRMYHAEQFRNRESWRGGPPGPGGPGGPRFGPERREDGRDGRRGDGQREGRRGPPGDGPDRDDGAGPGFNRDGRFPEDRPGSGGQPGRRGFKGPGERESNSPPPARAAREPDRQKAPPIEPADAEQSANSP